MSHSASSPKRWERWKLLGTTSPTATRPPAALNTSAIHSLFSQLLRRLGAGHENACQHLKWEVTLFWGTALSLMAGCLEAELELPCGAHGPFLSLPRKLADHQSLERSLECATLLTVTP